MKNIKQYIYEGISPMEREDMKYYEENFIDFFIEPALKELQISVNDYGYEYDEDNDEFYYFIDFDSYDSWVIVDDDKEINLVCCRTHHFDKYSLEYKKAYKKFLKLFKEKIKEFE